MSSRRAKDRSILDSGCGRAYKYSWQNLDRRVCTRVSSRSVCPFSCTCEPAGHRALLLFPKKEEVMHLHLSDPTRSIPRRRRRSRVASPLAAVAVMLQAAPAAAIGCTDIANIALPNTTITRAQSYAAGETVSGTTKAPVGLCRVAGTIKPGSQSNVHFEVWIPTDGSWNKKFQQIGNGGFAGSISLSGIANAVSRGYATAGTDDGTSGPQRARRPSSETWMCCSITATVQ